MGNQKSRIATLKKLVDEAEKSKDKTTHRIPYKGSRPAFAVVRVPIDLGLYNTQNGRTRVAQLRYIEENGLREDFFNDIEDPKVQAAQGKILLEMAEDEDEGKDLAGDLGAKGQHTPIVLTHDGTIVDGNRRTAAMREAEEEHIDAVVLPATATPQDLYETELELQITRDTKADYHWVDRLLALRFGLQERKETEKRLENHLRWDPGQLKFQMQVLDMVDAYLAWAGTPGKYHKIPTTERGSSNQAFTELTEKLTSNKQLVTADPETRLAVRNAVFANIRDGGEFKQNRDIITYLLKSAPQVLERLDANPEVQKARKDAPIKKQAKLSTDPLVQLAEQAEVLQSPALAVVGRVFQTPKAAEKVIEDLRSAVEDVKEELTDAQGRDPIRHLRKVETLLAKIEVTNPSQFAEASKILSRIKAQVDTLIGQAKGKK